MFENGILRSCIVLFHWFDWTQILRFFPQAHIPPGPLKDFSMNLFLAKQVHHLLGFPSGVSNTFSHTLLPAKINNIVVSALETEKI